MNTVSEVPVDKGQCEVTEGWGIGWLELCQGAEEM